MFQVALCIIFISIILATYIIAKFEQWYLGKSAPCVLWARPSIPQIIRVLEVRGYFEMDIMTSILIIETSNMFTAFIDLPKLVFQFIVFSLDD